MRGWFLVFGSMALAASAASQAPGCISSTVYMPDGSYTLKQDQQFCPTLRVMGVLTANRSLILTSTPATQYTIINATKGGFSLVVGNGFGAVVNVGNAPVTVINTDGNNYVQVSGTGGGGTPGVSSYNGRTGPVMPQSGDYTAAQTGAIPNDGTTLVQVGQIPALDVSKIATGVFGAARLPTASTTQAGIVGPFPGSAGVWLDGTGQFSAPPGVSAASPMTAGVVFLPNGAMTNLLAPSASTDTTNAANISSGTLNQNRLPNTVCLSNGTNCPAGSAGNPAGVQDAIQTNNGTQFGATSNAGWRGTGTPNAGIAAGYTRFYSNASSSNWFFPDIAPTAVAQGHTKVFGAFGTNSQVDTYSGTAAHMEAHMPSLFDFSQMGIAVGGGSPLNLGAVNGLNVRQLNMHVNGPGRNVGTGPAAWFAVSADVANLVCSAAGICELHKDALQANKYAGDVTANRRVSNMHPCNNSDPSGEGCQHEYNNMTMMDTYKATASATYATGTTVIQTTQINKGCNGAQSTGGDTEGVCSGGGGVLVDLADAGLIANGTVTAYANYIVTLDPNSMTAADSTTKVKFTPGVKATISGGVPDTTNFRDGGDQISLTFSNPTGTLPTNGSTGILCVFGLTGGTAAESLAYTMTGSNTATVTGHRLPHGGAVHGGDAGVYFNACPAVSAFANYGPDGNNRTATRVVGFPSANTMEIADYRTGQRFGGLFDFGGSFSFNAATVAAHPGAANVDVRQAAEVINTLDPSGQHSGWMQIAANTMTLTSGDSLEEAYRPATQQAMRNDYVNMRMTSTGVDKAYQNVYITGDVDRGIDIISGQATNVYNNPALTSSGFRQPMQTILRMRSVLGNHDGGMYNWLFQSDYAPLRGLLYVSGCAPGDTTATCANSPDYPVHQHIGRSGVDNAYWTYSPSTGKYIVHAYGITFSAQTPMQFQTPVSFGSAITTQGITATGNVTATGYMYAPYVSAQTFSTVLYTPASSSAPCGPGQIADDANYHYFCTANSHWRRIAYTDF